MSPLFHCAPIPLAPGSIIEPGNWGRMLKLYEPANGNIVQIHAFDEIALEFARLALAPDKPSRLNCVFTLPDLEGARRYRATHARLNLIYAVEPLSPSSTEHRGDYDLARRHHIDRYVPRAMDAFRDYWTRPPGQSEEVLVSCAVRILERVEE